MTRKWCVILGVIFTIFLNISPCRAQSDPPERFRKAIDLYRAGQCQEAWSEFWNLAANKDYYALYFLSAAISWLKFSGIAQTDFEKLVFPMFFYATLTSETDASLPIDALRKIIPRMMTAAGKDINQTGNKAVLECVASKEAPEACVNLAVESHLIPSYDEYISIVNAMNRNGLHVECAPPPGDRIPHE